MERTEPWYLAERAEHLAIVALTRLPNVSVSRQEQDDGIDLLVTISPATSGGRLFGVEVKGVKELRDAVDREYCVRKDYYKQLQRLAGDASIPVGLLIFEMLDDKGFFGWFLEPFVPANEGTPEVRLAEDLRVEELTTSKLEEIIRCVNDWYDAQAERRRR